MILDNTKVTEFNACPRKFYWAHVRHLSLVSENNLPSALQYGIAIHSGLETLYKGGSLEESIVIFKGLFPEKYSTTVRTPLIGEKMLRQYYNTYIPEVWKVEHVEAHITMELSKDLLFYGRIDLIVDFLSQLQVVDHKTATSMGYITEPQHQLTGYIALARSLGLDINTATVNILGLIRGKIEFNRVITSRTDEDIQEWIHHTLLTKCNIDNCVSSGYFPKYTHSCGMYNSRCPYLQLCTCSPRNIEYVVDGSYVIREWKPWEDSGINIEKRGVI